jgi:hypothetical protein
MLKKRTPFWREALSDVKTYKTHVRTTFGRMLKKCTPFWREALSDVKMY